MNVITSWIVARVWKNFGHVSKHIYRSGQMGSFMLKKTIEKKDIKFVIAMNMDGSNKDEEFEKEYCQKNGIGTLHYNLAAGGNADDVALRNIIKTLEKNEKEGIVTLIHCAGGRDRTGGALGCWMMVSNVFERKSDRLTAWLENCGRHKIPAEGWLQTVVDYSTKKIEDL